MQRGEVVTVVPLTSNTERVYPFQVLLPAAECGLRQDSKAQAEHMRAVAVARVGRRVATLSAARMAAVDATLRAGAVSSTTPPAALRC